MKKTTSQNPDNAGFLSKMYDSYNGDIFGDFDNSVHFGKLFIKIFGSLYSILDIATDAKIDDEKFIEGLKSRYNLPDEYILRWECSSNDRKDKKVTDTFIFRTFVIIKDGLALWIIYNEIYIIYTKQIPRSEVLEIAAFSDNFKKPIERKKEFHMIIRADNGFRLKDFELKDYNIDLDNNYNEDLPNIHDIITETLNEKKKNGIILLHGNYGTGKTYYIRHLISVIERKFIYLPVHMMDWLCEPEFIPFLLKFRDSVLILEDCEKILMSREDGNSYSGALSNLLNFGDGLLSDAFSLNILCSFNTNIRRIDEALLRKGRIIARYEFKNLEIPKAQSLADKLGKSIMIDKPMPLTDVFNAESLRFENKKKETIGFVLK